MALKDQYEINGEGDLQEGVIYSKKITYRKFRYFIIINELSPNKRFAILQYLIRDDFTSKCVELYYVLKKEFEFTIPFKTTAFLWDYSELKDSAEITLEDHVNKLQNLAKDQIDFFFSLEENIENQLKGKLKALKLTVQEYKKTIKIKK